MRAAGRYSRRRSSWRSPGSRAGSVRVCQVLRPRRVARALALAHSDVLPSATQTASAPGQSFLSRLNGSPVRTPCRRFADTLTDACARLGDDVVRYTFIAVDLHHLLLAGLPAHLCKNAKRSPLSKFRPSRSPVFDYFWSGNGEKTPEIEMAMSFYTTSAGSRHVGKRPKQTFRKGQPAAVELRLSSEIGAENPRSPRNR
jgi:hypothetical protein